MLLTTHIATGAAIGLLTGNPYAALAGGLISHHLLDRVPHFDVGSFYTGTGKTEADSLSELTFWEKMIVLADILISLVLFLWLIKIRINPGAEIYISDLWTKENTLISLAVLGAVFPDLFYNLSKMFSHRFSWFFTGVPFKYYHQFHERFHQVLTIKLWHIGLLIQLVLIGGSLWYILK